MQTGNVFQVSFGKSYNIYLYSETKKSERFLDEKNVIIAKGSHALKDYGSSYNVKTLNSFNLEL